MGENCQKVLRGLPDEVEVYLNELYYEGNFNALSTDLFSAKLPNELILDIGWYSNKYFLVRVFDKDWNEVEFEYRTSNLELVVALAHDICGEGYIYLKEEVD